MDNTPMPVKDWCGNCYYPSNSPCCICGSTHQTGIEPRFGYVVCEEHSELSPVDISNQLFNRTKE